jgi:hypothetical protein
MSNLGHTATFKQQLLPICLFTSLTIAMAGWLWGIGWITLAFAQWLMA